MNNKSNHNKSGIRRNTGIGVFIKSGLENGYVLNKCLLLKKRFLSLKLKVCGTFFLTFGLYTLVVGFLDLLFSDNAVSEISFYIGAAFAVCSLPLLFSSGTVSSAMTESVTGRVFCRYTGVRYEVSSDGNPTGHYGIAFIFGVVAGILTIFIPVASLLRLFGLIAAVSIIMFTPEAGLAIGAVSIFFCGHTVKAVILLSCAVSFAAKLFRGKRSAKLTLCDGTFAVFSLYVLLSTVVTADGGVTVSSLGHFLEMIPYFLIVLMVKDCRRITRLMTCLAVSAGVAFSLYNIAYAVSISTKALPFADSDFLMKAVASLPVFDGGIGAVCAAVMLPLSFGLSVRSGKNVPKKTLRLCALTDILYLVICGEYVCMSAGVIGIIVLLILTGKKSIYAFSAFLVAAVSSTVFFGERGRAVYRAVAETVYAAFSGSVTDTVKQGGAVSGRYLFSGIGFTGDNVSGNFYEAVLSVFGIIGAVLLASFLITALIDCIKTFRRTSGCKVRIDELERFGVLIGPLDTRLGEGAPLSAVLSLLICASFTNIIDSGILYTLLWMLTALTLAYARSADGEMIKAEGVAMYGNTPMSASVDLGN